MYYCIAYSNALSIVLNRTQYNTRQYSRRLTKGVHFTPSSWTRPGLIRPGRVSPWRVQDGFSCAFRRAAFKLGTRYNVDGGLAGAWKLVNSSCRPLSLLILITLNGTSRQVSQLTDFSLQITRRRHQMRHPTELTGSHSWQICQLR